MDSQSYHDQYGLSNRYPQDYCSFPSPSGRSFGRGNSPWGRFRGRGFGSPLRSDHFARRAPTIQNNIGFNQSRPEYSPLTQLPIDPRPTGPPRPAMRSTSIAPPEIPSEADATADPNVTESVVQPGDWGPDWHLPHQDDLDEWLQFEDCFHSLSIIGENSRENWADKPHETIKLNVQDTTQYTLFLSRNVVLCYFTDCCPQLAAFRAWAVYECNQWEWDILHVKFIGRNFFIIYFCFLVDRDLMLETKP